MSPNDVSPGTLAVARVDQRRTRADWMSRYVMLVRLGALALFLVLVYLQFTWDVLPKVSVARWTAWTAFFAGLSALADRYEIRIGSGVDVSAGFLADFVSAALFGPLSGAIVSSIGVFGGYRRGELQRKVTSACVFQIVAGVTGFVFWIVYAPRDAPWVFVVAGVTAGLVYVALNWVLFMPVAWFRHSTRPFEAFNAVVRPFLPFHLFFLSLSLVIIYSFKEYPDPYPALILLPVLGLVYAIRSYANLIELTNRMECFSWDVVYSMILVIDEKDDYTAKHSAQVCSFASDTAKALGLSKRDCKLAYMAGLLHDLGKIHVPDEILKSPDRLNRDQWAVIKEHSAAGQRVLGNTKEFEELARVVLYHHERFDGGGYPEGLSGEEIPRLSRIVSVADSYSAMITDRPYRNKFRPEVAMEEILHETGRQFDPEVATAFLALLERSDEQYRRGDQVDFQMLFRKEKARFLRDIS